MSKGTRRKSKLRTLTRRRDYVAAKAIEVASEAARSNYLQEQAALAWAVEVLEAAILIGSIDELERAAAGDAEGEAEDDA